jgi:hypothetical protein
MAGNHQSLITSAAKLVNYLDKLPISIKLSPGIIISKRSASKRNQKLKVCHTSYGLDATLTHNATIQKLRFYTSQQLLVQNYLEQFCQDQNIDFFATK